MSCFERPSPNSSNVEQLLSCWLKLYFAYLLPTCMVGYILPTCMVYFLQNSAVSRQQSNLKFSCYSILYLYSVGFGFWLGWAILRMHNVIEYSSWLAATCHALNAHHLIPKCWFRLRTPLKLLVEMVFYFPFTHLYGGKYVLQYILVLEKPSVRTLASLKDSNVRKLLLLSSDLAGTVEVVCWEHLAQCTKLGSSSSWPATRIQLQIHFPFNL